MALAVVAQVYVQKLSKYGEMEEFGGAQNSLWTCMRIQFCASVCSDVGFSLAALHLFGKTI